MYKAFALGMLGLAAAGLSPAESQAGDFRFSVGYGRGHYDNCGYGGGFYGGGYGYSGFRDYGFNGGFYGGALEASRR